MSAAEWVLGVVFEFADGRDYECAVVHRGTRESCEDVRSCMAGAVTYRGNTRVSGYLVLAPAERWDPLWDMPDVRRETAS